MIIDDQSFEAASVEGVIACKLRDRSIQICTTPFQKYTVHSTSSFYGKYMRAGSNTTYEDSGALSSGYIPRHQKRRRRNQKVGAEPNSQCARDLF